MEILSWNESIQVRRTHESLLNKKGGDSKKILTPSSPNTVLWNRNYFGGPGRINDLWKYYCICFWAGCDGFTISKL